jgi:hypothetical protein
VWIAQEMHMSTEFWLGVIVTIVVGLPGGYGIAILANMHTPRLLRYLESRKLLKRHKSRQQALVVFNRIKDFREHKRDRYPFYILLASAALVCAIIGSTLILILSIQNHEYPVSIEYGVLALLAALAMAFCLIFLGGLYETARQIERYDDYKAEFEERWGPIED